MEQHPRVSGPAITSTVRTRSWGELARERRPQQSEQLTRIAGRVAGPRRTSRSAASGLV